MSQVFFVYTIADLPTELANVTAWGEAMPLGLIPPDSPLRSRMFWVTGGGSLTDELFESIEEPELLDAGEGMSLSEIVGTALSYMRGFEQRLGPEAADELDLGLHTGDPAAVEAFLVEHGATLLPASELLADVLFIRATTEDEGKVRPIDGPLICSTAAGDQELEPIHHTGLFAIDRNDPALTSLELVYYDDRKRIEPGSVKDALLELRF